MFDELRVGLLKRNTPELGGFGFCVYKKRFDEKLRRIARHGQLEFDCTKHTAIRVTTFRDFMNEIYVICLRCLCGTRLEGSAIGEKRF